MFVRGQAVFKLVKSFSAFGLGRRKSWRLSFWPLFFCSACLRPDSFAEFFGIKTFGQNVIFWVKRFGFPKHFLGTKKLTGWFQSLK
jgi:hypothetical protein